MTARWLVAAAFVTMLTALVLGPIHGAAGFFTAVASGLLFIAAACVRWPRYLPGIAVTGGLGALGGVGIEGALNHAGLLRAPLCLYDSFDPARGLCDQPPGFFWFASSAAVLCAGLWLLFARRGDPRFGFGVAVVVAGAFLVLSGAFTLRDVSYGGTTGVGVCSGWFAPVDSFGPYARCSLESKIIAFVGSAVMATGVVVALRSRETTRRCTDRALA